MGLIYLWSSWNRNIPPGESLADVFELYELDDIQAKFWENLPMSGVVLAKEASESTKDGIVTIRGWYKKSFLEDEPFDKRRSMAFELEQLKTRWRMLNYFLGGSHDN